MDGKVGRETRFRSLEVVARIKRAQKEYEEKTGRAAHIFTLMIGSYRAEKKKMKIVMPLP